jgi:hypothetical protein
VRFAYKIAGDEGLHTRLQARGRCPAYDLPVRREQEPAPGAGDLGEFVEDARPMLGGERALIDAIDEVFTQGRDSGGGRLMT